MKKFLLFLLTLMFGFSTLQLSAQDIIQIPDNGGTQTDCYLPSYCYYNYSLTQQIYTDSEIGMAGSISSIAFYNQGSYDRTRNLSIYMVHTTKTSFSGSSDWITVTANDLVFSGSVTMPMGGWTTIPLTNTFEYDGSSNLAVIVDDNTGSWESSTYYRVFDATDQAIRVYSDGTNYDPYSPTGYSGTVMSVKNQIQLEITPTSVTCQRPTNPSVSNITAYEATLTWSPGDAESEWEIYYTTSSTDIPDSNTVAMETSYDTTSTLTNLTPNTYYYAYIRANCGNEYSKWKSVTPFRTQCVDISTLPYSENFDTYGTGSTAYPTCWSKINTYTSSQMPYVNSTNYQGSGSLYFYAGTANSYNIAIMEALDPSLSINNLQLTFMYRASNSTDRLIVGVMDDITDASTFTPVATIYPYQGSASTWEERVVNFSNYEGTGTNIAFKNEYASTYCYAYIDNVVLDLISECNRPTDILISAYTSEGAVIDWTPAGNEDSWEIAAVSAGGDPDTCTAVAASSHPFDLTGLQSNKQYDIYVRANCSSGDNSAWSVKRSFTTNPNCTVARNVTVSQVTTNSALVTWDNALFGASDYTVGHSVAGQNNWTTQTVSGTQYMLSDLTINTEYDVFVLTNCDLGEADSVFASFTTRSCMVGGDLQIGEGTSTTGYLPEYCLYNYSYSQQIYLASDMNGAAEISSIAFEASSIENASRHLKIYLMHTSAANSNWLNASNATLVYDGTPTLTTGWNTFNFTSPFQYNGTDNLAVIVIDATGSWSGTNSFYCHTTSQSLAHYDYQDDTPYSINTTPGSDGYGDVTNSRNNVIFGVPCDSLATCVAPNPYITEVTDNSITVAWTPGNTETSWELEYTADTIWNSEGTVTSPYTLSGLTDNTTYTIRVRSICGTGDESEPAVTSGRTACSVVNIPYTETFEDAPGSGYGNMVDCWTAGTNYSSSYPYTSSSYAHAGTYSAYFYGTGSYYSYMATPEFDANVAINTLQVAFWARKASANYFIQVGVMTDPNDYSTFEQVGGNITPDTINAWQLMEVNLDEYTGNGQYVAFRIPQSYTNYMYIDDININTIPTCAHVENITVSGIGATEATVEWVEGGDESSWEVAFVQGTGAVDMDTVVINPSSSPSYTTTDLEQNSIYTVYVRAICGSGSSSIWMSAEFMTSQIPAIMPYTCDFEDADEAAAFGIVNGTQPHQWVVGTATHNGGSHALYISSDNGTSNSYSITNASNTWVYRDIEFPASPAGYTLSFDWHAQGESCCDYMRVFIGDPAPVAAGNNSDPAGATSLAPNVNSSYPNYFNTSTNYQTFSATLPGLEETTVKRIFFLWHNDGSVGTNPPAAVDNISISPNYCDAPTNVTISNITSTEAEISWTSTASSSVLEYRGPNDNDWIVIDPATSPQTLTNLDPVTTYTVRVANNCDDGVSISPYTTTSFMTACDVITNLPYTENFDSYTASSSTRPNCWAFPVTYSNAPYITSSYYSSQPNSLYFQSLTTNPTTAVSPQFAEDINNLRVKFMLKAESITYSGTFEVGVMSDPTADSTFESVRIIQPANTDWNQYVVDFDSTSMTGGNRYIAFRQNSNSSSYYYWLDNVMVMNIPSCPEPDNLTSTANTSTSITLDWTSHGETDWNIEYGPTGFTPGEGDIIPVTSHPYEVENLESDSTYDFYVQAVCGAGDESIWVGPYTIKPGTYIMPTSGNNSITACELTIYDDGGPSGNYSSNCNSTLTINPVDAFHLVAIEGTINTESCCDYLEIYDGPTATGTPIGEYTSGTIPQIISTTGPLTLYFYSDGSIQNDGFALTVSCISNTCPMPTNLTVSNISSTTAELTWTPGGNENSWNVEYKEASATTWTTDIANTPSYQFTGLTDLTEYDVRVQADCSDETSMYATTSFITMDATALPYQTDFATDQSWLMNNGTAPNYWMMGTPSGATTPALFVTNNGTSAGYNITSVSVAMAEKLFAMPADDSVHVEFDVQVGGEGTYTPYDYLKVFLAPSTVEFTPGATSSNTQSSYSYDVNAFDFSAYLSQTEETSYPFKLSLTQDSTLHISMNVVNPAPNGSAKIVFLWRNDSSNGYQPGAVISNFSISTTGAPVVTDPTVATNQASAITQTSATLNATINNPSSVAITAKGFEWKTTTGGTYTQIAGTGTGNSFTADLTGLTANTSYTYKAFITFNGNTVYGSEMSFTTQNGGGETCNVPTNLTATATAYNTADVNWTAGGTETAWNLRYRTGAANWTTVAATTTSYQLTGLSAQTTYEVQVQAVCSSTSSSDWTVSVSFTTPAVPVDPCVAPTGLTISDVTTNSATATWTPGGSETAWNIQYKLQSASQWQEATVQTTSYDIEGLSAASTYEVRVKAICSADNQSDFVTTTFTTGVGIDNITLANSINLMPNPADNYIDLTINSNVEVKEAVVYNAFGQMIQTVELNDNHARIDLSDMAAGMYFVRVNGDNVSATKKFIKR